MHDLLFLTACAVDLAHERVVRGDEVVQLTTREARLLAYLADRPGQDVSRDELLTRVWGYSSRALSRAVDATVLRVRAKIERDPAVPDHLHTAWGKGYRWVPPDQRPRPGGPGGDLLGRADTIAAVETAFEAGWRLVTLTGPSGVGKTRLAAHLAHRWRGASTSTIDLADCTDEASIRIAVGDIERLDKKEHLLVLDSLEPAIGPATTYITWLLAQTRRTRVLCTSQEPLAITAERAVAVEPLALEDAVALLRDRAADPKWRDFSTLAAIATALDRLPLALELAAGLASLLDPDGLLLRLDHPLPWLVSQRRDVPERHRSLRLALARTFELSTPAELAVLRHAATFTGGFTVDGLLGVLDNAVPDALGALARLRARSLVHPVDRPGDGTRLTVYAAVRAYVADAPGPALEWAREAHRRWFVGAARRMSTRGGPPNAADTAFLLADAGNFLLAARASLAVSPADAAEATLAVFHALTRIGPIGAALDLLDACLAADLPLATQGHLHRRRADCLMLLGRQPEAARSAEQSVRIAEAVGDRLLEGYARGVAAVITVRSGRAPESIPGFERALAIIRDTGDRAAEANLLGNYGTALWITDRPASDALERAVWMHRESGNERSAMIMLANLGLYDIDRGHLDRSGARLSDALAAQRRLQDRLQEGITLGHLANLALVRDDPAEAIRLAEAAITLLAEAEEGGNRPHVHLGLGVSAWYAGDPARARRELEQAVGRLPQLEHGFSIAAQLDVVLRVDAGETGDPLVEIERLAPALPWLRSRSLRRLAEGYLWLATDRDRARDALVPLSDHPLMMSVEPFRRELIRRLRD